MKISALRVLTTTFMLTPLWWVLGTGFFVFHIAALLAAVAAPQALRPRDAFQYLLLTLISLLGLSMMMSAASGAADLSRVVAALNNISILLNGYIFYSFLNHSFRTNTGALDNLFNALGKVGLFSVVIGVPCVYLLFFRGVDSLSFPTLFGIMTPPQDNLLGLYQKSWLIDVDWFAESSIPRLTILSTNATSSAALIAFASYFFLASLNRGRRALSYAFIFALLCTMAATLTRGAILGVVIGLAIYFVLSLRKNRKLIVAGSVLSAVIGLTFAAPVLEAINSARQASSDTRFAIYEMSLAVTLKEGPLIGLGVKPRLDQTAIPIGSHSTILSLLVRGGLIGAALSFTLFLVIPVVWSAKALLRALAAGHVGDPRGYSIAMIAAMPSFLVYCIFQDIDAYAPLSAFLFAYLAVISFIAKGPYFSIAATAQGEDRAKAAPSRQAFWQPQRNSGR